MDTEAKQPASAGCHPTPCSPSSETPQTDGMAAMLRTHQEWKNHAEKLERELGQYRRANASLDKAWAEMLALLRRIARKGEFMDREGLRLTVSDWLARRHLSEIENSPDAGEKGKANE